MSEVSVDYEKHWRRGRQLVVAAIVSAREKIDRIARQMEDEEDFDAALEARYAEGYFAEVERLARRDGIAMPWDEKEAEATGGCADV